MSSRQLRKLREKQDLAALAQREAEGIVNKDDEESDSGAEDYVVKPQKSLFAALGDQGDDDDSDDDGDDDDGNEPETGDDAQTKINAALPSQTSPDVAPKKKKNRGKKKRKGKKGGVSNDKATNNNTALGVPVNNKDGDGDEIDRILRELNMKDSAFAASGSRNARTATEIHKELFSVNSKNLKERTEMIAVFGRDVINATESANTQPPQVRPDGTMTLEDVLRQYARGKLPDITLKRNIFIDGKESWPKSSAEGLMMERVGKQETEACTDYKFVGNSAFNKIKKLFYRTARLGDLGSIIGGVHSFRKFPSTIFSYHVMYLLQCYLIAKDHDKNHAIAADLTQRALFTFGRVSLSSFRKDVENGAARLDFAHPENRWFFLAGYRNIRALVQKGAYRTAFEWAKLLLALQPNQDVYGMNHVIHMLAVRTHQVDWLEAFLGWYKDNEAVAYAPEHAYYRHSLVPGLLQQGKTAEAHEVLRGNIENMPWLYCRLFQVLEIDPAPAIWGVQPPTDIDDLFTEIYVAYGKDLWASPEVKSILRSTALAAKRLDVLETTRVTADLRTTRFIYLENNAELMSRLPNGALAVEPNYDFDPLPPPQAENIFTDPEDSWPWDEAMASHGGNMAALGLEGVNLQNLGGVGDIARQLLGGVFGLGRAAGRPRTDEEAIAALLEADELEARGHDEFYDEFGEEDMHALNAELPARPYQVTVEEVEEEEEEPVGSGAGRER
ncbi:putative protein.01 [Ceratocystis platani]|uniref:Transcription factor 25 n=1 Tax=Ceratocystis fimbriata f. sp. platani TaxID=88771 RepID=A0A0F8CWK1_CERFI|nr:putative protein.01 [Ceratocystis platani]